MDLNSETPRLIPKDIDSFSYKIQTFHELNIANKRLRVNIAFVS